MADAQVTTATADAVTSQIIHRWPDEIGKPMLNKQYGVKLFAGQ
jgi:hypothetical protein